MEPKENSVYECPICFENLFSPIYQCYNGHLICTNCMDKVRSCPVCRDRMPQKRIRNLEVEKLVGKAPFLCQNKDKGCLDQKEHSSMDCEYFVANFCSKLELKTCNERIRKGELVAHLMEDHGISGEMLNADELVEVEQSHLTCQDLESGELKWKPTFICEGKHTFFLQTFLKNEEISWQITFLGSDAAAKGLEANIKLRCDDKSSLKWRSPIPSLMSEEPKDSFRMSTKILKSFWKEDPIDSSKGSWKLNVRVKRTKKGENSREVAAKIKIEAENALNIPEEVPPPFLNNFGLGQKNGPSVFTIFVQSQPGIRCIACGNLPMQRKRYLCNVCKADFCHACWSTQTEVVNFHNNSFCKLDFNNAYPNYF